MTFVGTEHPNPHEAIQHLDCSADDVAFSLFGRVFTAKCDEYRRLQSAGYQPSTWHYHEPTGRLMCVPGRHG